MNYYLVRYTDMQGTKRMYLAEAEDFREGLQNFYLDECPDSIQSMIQQEGRP